MVDDSPAASAQPEPPRQQRQRGQDDPGSRRRAAPPMRPDGLIEPHRTRFAPDAPGYEAAMAAHRSAAAAGEAGYLDPMTGLFVMTAPYLLDRGWCCDRGCRHCPWVDDPAG